ncbi:MAG: hypothetical protein EXR61_05500, partial [Chloroflexi bacterium]|nr:hypothetical protein [Chloroflexota bacterium]
MIGETAFAAVGMLFLLAALRALTSQIYHSLYLGLSLPNAVVAGVAFAVFGLSLGALAVSSLGPRRAIGWSAVLLVIATTVGALVRNEWLLLAIWTAGVSGGTWWLALLHASRAGERPAALPVALPAALIGDLVLRTAFGTVAVVDLPPATAFPVIVTGALVLLASGIAALGPERTWASPGPRGTLGLLALPALLLVSETGGTNGAQIAAAAGVGLNGGPSGELGGLVVGAGLTLGLVGLSRNPDRRLVAALALTLGATLLWLRVPLLSLVGGAVLCSGVVLAGATLAGVPLRPARSPALAGVALFGGWLIFAAAAFAYHALYDFLPALYVATALTALASLVVPAARPVMPASSSVVPAASSVVPASSPPRTLSRVAVTVGGALALLVPAIALVLAPQPVEVPAPATFRLMTWNVNQGFDAGQVAAIDAIVLTIAREAPDVVVLQEVTRGWMINQRHDLLAILGARLGMRTVFGPQIGDLYGNAILSRLPVTDIERIDYPKEPGLRYQPRGALLARIAGTQIVVTHLDHNADASRVRSDQVSALLEALRGRLPAVVVGDLNALSGSPELGLLTAAGFW